MFERYGYARHAGYRGGWGGHHGHHRGPGPLLPFLAGALLMRAAIKGSHRRHDHGWKRGPWRRWQDGPPHFGRRGDWWGSDEQRQMREAFFALRSEVGPTMALLRDAFRQGTLDSAKLNEIRAVLSETRRRIAAIVSGTGPVEV
jgi:hypothetical protein